MKLKGVHAAPVLMIIVMVLFAAANFINIGKITGTVNPYLTVAILEIVCLGLPTVFFCILRGNEYKGRLRLNFFKVRHLTAMAYTFIIMICVSIALSIGLYWLFPEAFAASASGLLETNAANAGGYDRVYAIVCFCIIPAILEELLLRGVVLAEYSPYGAALSVFMSSLLFSMLHFSPVRMPIYFISGILLSILALMTDSIVASSLVHMLYNVFTMLFEGYIYKIAGKSSGGLILLMFIVISLLLLAMAFLFGRGKKLYKYRAEDNEPSPLRRVKKKGEASYLLTAVLSPTFLITILLYIVIAIIL